MKTTLFLVAFTALTLSVSAQKMKIESGNLSFLKDQTEINVEFDFSNATFYNEKMSEQDYINKRLKEIGDDKGKAEADKWLEDWNSSKEDSFTEKFITSFNNYGKIQVSEDDSAPYTLIVETVWIYPGWFAGVMKQPAKITTNLKFVETANRNNVLAVISSKNAPGDGYFIGVANNNDRISEGYAKTGKSLAGLVKKRAK
ncbi:MAG: hypothetical protein GX159_01745 [Flavobacteriaceae bacterium]|jgi:hypothetical protein|nr:hypothetical protein [Flavobacteriaceae bacterium]